MIRMNKGPYSRPMRPNFRGPTTQGGQPINVFGNSTAGLSGGFQNFQNRVSQDPTLMNRDRSGGMLGINPPRGGWGGNMTAGGTPGFDFRGGRGGQQLGEALAGMDISAGGLQSGPAAPSGNSAPPLGPPMLGPGDQAPNQYQGMTGSEIFARLFGQRP